MKQQKQPIRILVLAPHPNDGCSWWRVFGPLQEMRKAYPGEFEVTIADRKSGWSDLGAHDIMLVQRPFKESAIHLIEMGKALGVKIWLDYDDNIIGVPVSNPAHETFGLPRVKQDVAKLAHLADAITVTNNELASVFLPVNPKVYVIPNGFSDLIFKTRSTETKRPSQIIAWRGSQSHDADLDYCMPAIVRLTKDFPMWKWLFMGKPYFKVVSKIPESQRFYVEPVPLPKYFNWLNTLNAEIAIVPLEDNDFNKCKSNIAWQEFTYAGAACVVPNWPHWDVPGATTYSDPDTFYDAVSQLIRNEATRKQRVEDSLGHLKAKWMLSRMNNLRAQLIHSLVPVV